jgi:phage anti-repressor protein
MEKLIKKVTINGEEQMGVNARDLWEALKSKRQFGNWIQDRLVGFEEGVDFTVNKIVNGENKGRFAATEYTLTLDTAKHLAMLERNEIGKRTSQDLSCEVEDLERKLVSILRSLIYIL